MYANRGALLNSVFFNEWFSLILLLCSVRSCIRTAADLQRCAALQQSLALQAHSHTAAERQDAALGVATEVSDTLKVGLTPRVFTLSAHLHVSLQRYSRR